MGGSRDLHGSSLSFGGGHREISSKWSFVLLVSLPSPFSFFSFSSSPTSLSLPGGRMKEQDAARVTDHVVELITRCSDQSQSPVLPPFLYPPEQRSQNSFAFEDSRGSHPSERRGFLCCLGVVAGVLRIGSEVCNTNISPVIRGCI